MEDEQTIECEIAHATSVESDANLWNRKYNTLLPEELAEELSQIEPYVLDESKKHKVSAELNAALKGFIEIAIGDKLASKRKLEVLCTSLFCHVDLYMLVLRRLIKHIPELSSAAQYWNLYECLRLLPVPDKKLPFFFNAKVSFARPGTKNKKLQRLYQNAWLEIAKHKLPVQLLQQLVPYLCEHALSVMPDGYLFGDFFFRVFDLSHLFATLALEGIFKLMIHHNFEYPDFYSSLYKLTIPSVCYMDSRKKFFTLLDTFLSSTHLPTYIVAAFIKRLCRLTLTAPLVCQEPLLGLIRNLITRHKGVRVLVHRQEPKVLESDPYDEMEGDMQKCGAMESSLWEIQAIQKHWYIDVAKRANFIEKGIPNVEGFIRWKTSDEYFTEMMSKNFSRKANNEHENTVNQWQLSGNEESDNNENEDELKRNVEEITVEQEPERKKRRKTRLNSEGDTDSFALAINTIKPTTDFFSNKFCFPMSDYWKF